jgi:hypothetical protein
LCNRLFACSLIMTDPCQTLCTTQFDIDSCRSVTCSVGECEGLFWKNAAMDKLCLFPSTETDMKCLKYRVSIPCGEKKRARKAGIRIDEARNEEIEFLKNSPVWDISKSNAISAGQDPTIQGVNMPEFHRIFARVGDLITVKLVLRLQRFPGFEACLGDPPHV